MHPRICVNGISTWNWTLDQDIAFYRTAGIKVINLPFFKISTDVAAGVEAIKQAGRDAADRRSGARQPETVYRRGQCSQLSVALLRRGAVAVAGVNR
jgi:hypothetical protein